MAWTSASFHSSILVVVEDGLLLRGGHQSVPVASVAVAPRYSGSIWFIFQSVLDITLSRFGAVYWPTGMICLRLIGIRLPCNGR